jgi:hypothetical protein
MFEASNAIDQRYTPYYQDSGVAVDDVAKLLQEGSTGSDEVAQRVAVCRAAQVILDGLFAPPPSEPSNPLGPMRRFAHAQQFTIQTSAIDPADLAYLAGYELGTLIGERVILDRANDGHPPTNPPVVNGSEWDQYQYDLPYFLGAPQSAGYPQVRAFGLPALGMEGGETSFVSPPLLANSPAFQAQVRYLSYLRHCTLPRPLSAHGVRGCIAQWEETWAYGTSDASSSRRTAETDAAAVHSPHLAPAAQISVGQDRDTLLPTERKHRQFCPLS